MNPSVAILRALGWAHVVAIDDILFAIVREGFTYAHAWGALVDSVRWPHMITLLCEGVPCVALTQPLDEDETIDLTRSMTTRPPPRRRKVAV